MRIPAYVAETAEGARDEPEASTRHAIQYGAQELSGFAASQETAERLQRRASVPYDELLKQRLLYGTPEAVVDRLQAYEAELGISSLVLEMNYGGQIPYDRIIHSMQLLTEKIVPKFK